MQNRRSIVRVWGIVIGSVLGAFFARWFLDLYLEESSAYVFFLAATALVAWTSGFVPGLVSLGLGFLLANWFFIEPRLSLYVGSADGWVNAIGYALVGLAMTWFSKKQRNAQARAAREASAAEAQRRELELEMADHRQTRAAREMLAAIVESADDAIMSKSPEGTITSWNVGAERLFGYTAAEVIGLPVTTIMPPECYNEEKEILARIRCGESLRQFETVRLRKDGSRVDVSLRISPVRDGEGRLVGASTVARDITARKEEERALRQAQGELTRRKEDLEQEVAARTAALTEVVHHLEGFAHTVSHDLRAPLRAVKGMTRALCEDYGHLYDQQGKDYADHIIQAVDRMEHLIAALLAYSRVGRGEIPVVAIELEEYLGRLRKHWTAELQAHGAQLEIARHLPPVIANPTLLDQVLTNLVSNAVKFVAPGTVPHVQLAADEIDGVVRLKVIDNGIGIPQKHCAKLFQVFSRLHPVEKYPGLGIGLVIVRKAAERMGGRVGVESEPGKGSCFWVELPKAS